MKTTKEYTKAKRAFLFGNLCKRCLSLDRFIPATDLHHSRGRLGKLLLDTRFWVALCRTCHRWCHDNPAAARKVGLMCKKGLWNTPHKGNLDV